LKRQIQELRIEARGKEALIEENRRLRNLLQFRKRFKTDVIAADVIGYSPENWCSSIVINRGTEDGVGFDNPCVCFMDGQEGLVGRVIFPKKKASVVLLILDLGSRIGVKIARTGHKAVAIGRNTKFMDLRFLSADADVVLGDLVLTSGDGGLFPPDIPIGKIKFLEKRKYELFYRAKVLPFVDFSRLKDVLVLLGNSRRKEYGDVYNHVWPYRSPFRSASDDHR
jgi:rod shape-determining protein MreC